MSSTTPVGSKLLVRGRTNLVDGARLLVHVGGKGGIHGAGLVNGQKWEAEAALTSVQPGTYRVEVEFSLEAQSPQVQEQLGFQPRRLSTIGELTVDVATGIPPRPAEFRALFDEVNATPQDPATIDDLDGRLVAFNKRAGISRYREAAHSLRLALEAARRRDFSREEFEEHLLRAHVQAGL